MPKFAARCHEIHNILNLIHFPLSLIFNTVYYIIGIAKKFIYYRTVIFF